MQSFNPASGDLLATYPDHSAEVVTKRIERAVDAQRGWSETTYAQRADLLESLARQLDAGGDELARLMALEMGKPLAQGRAELAKCARTCRYYATNGERFLADRPIETDHAVSFVHQEPLGVVLAVMPWNFPFWQVIRFAAPALMAGNAAVLKHASNVSGCALAIEELCCRAGLGDGLFATLLIGSDAVSEVISHPGIAAVTLTGSAEAGRAVAAKAGAELKKTVLELGGSDPYLVLADADLDEAARICAESRLLNGGQSCISAKRFIVVGEVYDAFCERFVARLGDAVVGDPLDEATTVGPLARRDLRDTLQRQVDASVAAGARVALGGRIPAGLGAFYPPTCLVDVWPGMAAFDEETFGPVAAVACAADTDDAVRLANLSPFGLGAAVFTADRDAGVALAAHRLRAGNVFVNALVSSDPRLPFGGIGQSGYGRELSDLGIREFVNAKTVVAAR